MRVLMRVYRFLLLVATCIMFACTLGTAQGDRDALEGKEVGDPVELDLSVLITFLENDNALAWDGDGYVELHNIFGYTFLRTEKTLSVRANGTVKSTGETPVIHVEKLTPLERTPELPPVLPPPESLAEQPPIIRTSVEGVVRHVIELNYSVYFRLEVDGDSVTCQLRALKEDVTERIITGQRLRFDGYLWKPRNSYKARDPDVQMLTKHVSDYEILEQVEETRGIRFEEGMSIEEGKVYYLPQLINKGGAIDAWHVLMIERLGQYSAMFDCRKTGYQMRTLVRGVPFDLYGTMTQIAPRSYKITTVRIVSRGNTQAREPVVELSHDTLKRGVPIGASVRASGTVVGHSKLKTNDHLVELQFDAAAPDQVLRVHYPKAKLGGVTVEVQDKIAFSGMYVGHLGGYHRVRPDVRPEKLVVSANLGKTVLLWFGGTLLVGLLAAAWIFSLRRSVRERTAKLSASEASLRASEANLRAVYSTVPEAFLAATSDGTIFSTNGQFNTWFDNAQFQGGEETAAITAIAQYFDEADGAWHRFVAGDGEARALGVELAADLPTLGPRILGVRVHPIELEDAAEGRLWVFRDITEEKQLEKSLVQSSKLEAIGRLTGGIAHDFNNLLTAVTGNLSLLEMELEDPEHREYVHNASTGAIRASELVKQLLDYAKQTRLELRVCSVNDILIDLHDLLRHGMNSRFIFEFDLAHDLRATEVDVLKIEQVFMNLLINATDAMPDGGSIKVLTRNLPVADGEDFSPVEIIVEDTGTGMPDEVLRNIFEPFFSTKGDRGTGLGLSTALGIIEQHQGTISCESELGVGTRFRICLPSCAPDEEEPKVEEPEEALETALWSSSGSRPKVLVVDDEPTVRLFLRSALQRYDCDVVCFPNGKEAVDFFAEEHGDVDLVICDNSMPIMDGVLTYAAVRESCPDTPFVVVSGYLIDLEQYAIAANGQKPDGFLQKPLSVKTLRSMLHGALA